MSRTARRFRSLAITVVAVAAANIAISFAGSQKSGVSIIPDGPRPKSGVTIIPDGPRPKSGVTIIPDGPRPKSGVSIIPDGPRP